MKKILAFYLAVFFIAFTISETSVKADDNFDMNGEITGEINIQFYDNTIYESFLKGAALRFEQKYPGTKVNVSGFSTYANDGRESSAEDYSKGANDYITRVNVEMMSGIGADIYAIDVLPAYKYADSGQFVDLRGFMDNDPNFDYDDYQKDVFDAVMYRGGQYILPTKFDVDILSYDKNLLDVAGKDNFGSLGKYTYDQLFDIGIDSFLKNNNEESPVKIMNISGAYNAYRSQMAISFNVFAGIGDRKANFTDGTFAKMLNDAKEYEQKGYINSSDLMIIEAGMPTIYKATPLSLFLQSLISDEDPNTAMGFEITKNDVIIGLLANINGDVTIRETNSYAMNTNSKNKRTAWEFIKFLVSEEMQMTSFYGFLPVNKNSLVTSAVTVIYNSLTAGRYRSEPLPPDAELSESQQIVLDKYLDYVETFLPMVDGSTGKESIISDMITSEVIKFFDGVKTANEVADTLQSKVDMYLQE